MDARIDHVAGGCALRHVFPREPDFLVVRQLVGQRPLDSAAELRVGLLLDALDLVPQRTALAESLRRVVWQRDSQIRHQTLVPMGFGEIKHGSLALELDGRARYVCGTSDGGRADGA